MDKELWITVTSQQNALLAACGQLVTASAHSSQLTFTICYLIVHEVVFSQVDLKRRGRHRTLVADLADDVSHICSFASRDASLLDNKEEFNHTCSLFVGQAGDLGCFKCPSCAKPYISATWFQKHLSTCPQPTGAITGLNWTELICYLYMPCWPTSRMRVHILKVWHPIKNPIPSIDAYVLQEQLCLFLCQSDLKWWSVKLFQRASPNNKILRRTTVTTWVVMCDQFLIQEFGEAQVNKSQCSTLSGASSSRSPALPTRPYLLPSLPTSIHPWNITLHLVRLTLNCCSFPVSVHVSVLAASLFVAAPTIWNSLPLAILSSVSTYSFRCQLKTCFPAFLTPHSTQRLRFVGSLADIVHSTNYLLAYILTAELKGIQVVHIVLLRRNNKWWWWWW